MLERTLIIPLPTKITLKTQGIMENVIRKTAVFKAKY